MITERRIPETRGLDDGVQPIRNLSSNHVELGNSKHLKQYSQTPKRGEIRSKVLPQIFVHDPMTERTEQSNAMAVDCEGRGFTDSQQLSLDSDMHNLFGYPQQQDRPHYL